VWLLPPQGEAEPITNEPLGVTNFRFGGDALVVLAPVLPGVPHDEQRARAKDIQKNGPSMLRYRAMPVRQWDHWEGRAAPHLIAYDEERRDLTPHADRELREVMMPTPHTWIVSRDGRMIVTEWCEPGNDRVPDVHLVSIDVKTGQMRDLVRRETAMAMKPVLSPDGKRLAFTLHVRSRERHGKIDLCALDLASMEVTLLAKDWDRWGTPHEFTPDGSHLLVTADDEADVPVFSMDLLNGNLERLTTHGCHEHVQVHPDGRSIVGLRHTLMHPPEPFQAPLRKIGEPLVVARASGFEPYEGVEITRHETRVVEGVSSEKIQWLLVRLKRNERSPVLFWIHGGPVGQFADAWHWRWNPLVFAAAGYAVVLPNPRGSTGRGQEFVEGIWRKWGAECFRDLMSVADDVAKLPSVDGARMAAMGGSFGGYMANFIGGQTARFRCLVTHASLYHLETFAQTTDIPAWCELDMGASPDELNQYSPHRAIANWKTPTLILHGDKDYRVPIHEALALFEALQARGVESELCVFPDENHWILRPRNVIAWYETIRDFLSRHV